MRCVMTRVLPRARTGEDQQRTVDVFNRRALLRVHVFKQSGHLEEKLLLDAAVGRGIGYFQCIVCGAAIC